jgi:peroxiredoxin
MKADYNRFAGRKARLVVIAPHGAEKVRAYWEKEELPFAGVPDPDGIMGKLYRQEWNLIKLGRMPALFVVDRSGLLAFVHYSRTMADIPPNKEILDILDRQG